MLRAGARVAGHAPSTPRACACCLQRALTLPPFCARRSYRMLPILDATGRRTAAVALRNALYMVPLGAAACALGVTTPPFAWEAAALSGCLAAGAAAFLAHPSQASARRLFLLSLVHLPVLQLACVAHRVPNTAAARAAAPASLADWSAQHRAWLAAESAPPRQDVIRTALNAGGVSVAPFPLLPAPRSIGLQCPSRAACQSSATDAPGAGSSRAVSQASVQRN
jgi:protoheme IX farnesyltransferase